MSPATVERSTLNWKELSVPDHRFMLELYRGLIALRHEYPELADPRLDAFTIDTGPAAGGRRCTGATCGRRATWPARSTFALTGTSAWCCWRRRR